jgi:hypothetical protein
LASSKIEGKQLHPWKIIIQGAGDYSPKNSHAGDMLNFTFAAMMPFK